MDFHGIKINSCSVRIHGRSWKERYEVHIFSFYGKGY
jgi:hypothetical protein